MQEPSPTGPMSTVGPLSISAVEPSTCRHLNTTTVGPSIVAVASGAQCDLDSDAVDLCTAIPELAVVAIPELSLRGRKRKAVDYSVSAKESKNAGENVGWWMV